jgi:hypothetical protein
MESASDGVPMRLSTKTKEIAARAVGILVLAVFLQWMGLPTGWPAPPGTIYADIASTIG